MSKKSNNPARELTVKEARERFLHHVWTMAHYWDELSNMKTQRERLQGLAFSILVMLDGEAAEFPGFEVIPLQTSKTDIQFLKSLPDDDVYPRQWFPNEDIIGGEMLHDEFYEFGKKHGYIKD